MRNARSQTSRQHRARMKTFGVGLLALLGFWLADVVPAAAETLDRVRETGKLTLGYRLDAGPFSYRDGSGKAAGYSIELCEKIADEVKVAVELSNLALDWVPVTLEDRFRAVQESRIDLLCGADTVTLSRRKDVAFSIPIFESGIGVVVRADAPIALRGVLGGQPQAGPIWRGSPALVLENKTFAAVTGTTSERWLADRYEEFRIPATLAAVKDYASGLHRVLDGSADAFFGDRPILVDAVRVSSAADSLLVLDHLFTSEHIALALARNDDDFRLTVDRALSRLYGTTDFRDLYFRWFGELDENTLNYFRIKALAE